MEKGSNGGGKTSNTYTGKLGSLLRKCVFTTLSVGPIPNHLAFIMDGNRRYAKKHNLKEGAGHNAGFSALMSLLQYCYELGVQYVTVYAFSIDNFKRRPEEVESLMDLMQEKIDKLIEEESIVDRYGIRICFIGNLKLLKDSVREAAERAMKATAKNSKSVLSVCVAYTSTDEITHAVQESCREKLGAIEQANSYNEEEGNNLLINLVDIEKKMYMVAAPDPDIIIRTSGETRLSNFLLWQSACSHLYSPPALWPEVGFWHLVWAVLNFQRDHWYLEKIKKQI